jgi:hypothetical protein
MYLSCTCLRHARQYMYRIIQASITPNNKTRVATKPHTCDGAGTNAAGAHLMPTTCWPHVASAQVAANKPPAADVPSLLPRRASKAESRWGTGSKPTSSSARKASGPRLSTAYDMVHVCERMSMCVCACVCRVNFAT